MWKEIIFLGIRLMAWIPPADVCPHAPPDGFMWAQIADDAPFRLVKKM